MPIDRKALRRAAVSPLSVGAFVSARGLSILASELIWVWLPSALLGAALWLWSRRRGEAP